MRPAEGGGVSVRTGEGIAKVGREGRAAWAKTFAPVLEELRTQIRRHRPEQIAAASGATWEAGTSALHLHFLDQRCRITWPALVAYLAETDRPCDPNLQGLLMYYLATADGTPLAGQWIAFRELPDGWLYHQAFQGYTGDELVRALGNDLDAFERVARKLGGRAESGLGDAGYAFDVLPRLRIAITYWLGDDEFPPHAQILFDAAASHYLPTDGLAVLGHRIVHRLVKEVS